MQSVSGEVGLHQRRKKWEKMASEVATSDLPSIGLSGVTGTKPAGHRSRDGGAGSAKPC